MKQDKRLNYKKLALAILGVSALALTGCQHMPFTKQNPAAQAAGHAGLVAAATAEGAGQGQPERCSASRSPAGAVGKPARTGLESRNWIKLPGLAHEFATESGTA